MLYNFSEVRVEIVPDNPPPPPAPPPPPPTPPSPPLEPPTAIRSIRRQCCCRYRRLPHSRRLVWAVAAVRRRPTRGIRVVTSGSRRENEGSKAWPLIERLFQPGLERFRHEPGRVLIWGQDKPIKKATFGIEGGRPVIAIWQRHDRHRCLRWTLVPRSQRQWRRDDGDRGFASAKKGSAGDGDWDGDGKTDLGICPPGPATATRGGPRAGFRCDNTDDSGRFVTFRPARSGDARLPP